MEHRNWRWVSRDTVEGHGDAFVDVWLDDEQPKPREEYDGIIFDGGRFAPICHAEFLATTGIDIQSGTCVKVEFTAKVIEE